MKILRTLSKTGFNINGGHYIPQNAEFFRNEMGNNFFIFRDDLGFFLIHQKYGRVECRNALDNRVLGIAEIHRFLCSDQTKNTRK